MYQVRYSFYSDYPWQVWDDEAKEVVASFKSKRRLLNSAWMKHGKIPPKKQWWSLAPK